VVQGDRGDHRDGAVGHVGGVPGAAEADLDHGDVHRHVGEDGERHAGEDLEEGQRDRLAAIHQRQVGGELGVAGHELLG
jgi:hypothetical protein